MLEHADELLRGFDEGLWSATVEMVMVQAGGSMVFRWRNGVETGGQITKRWTILLHREY